MALGLFTSRDDGSMMCTETRSATCALCSSAGLMSLELSKLSDVRESRHPEQESATVQGAGLLILKPQRGDKLLGLPDVFHAVLGPARSREQMRKSCYLKPQAVHLDLADTEKTWVIVSGPSFETSFT